MPPNDVKAERRRSPEGAALVGTSIVAGCLAVVFSLPVPVAPREAPPLVVSAAQDARARALDVAASAQAPSSDAVRSVESWVRQAGARERGELPPRAGSMREEGEAVRASVEHLVTRHGEVGLRALLARWALSIERALTVDPARRDAAQRQWIGGFEGALELWGARRASHLVARGLVVRTLAKARLAVILRRLPAEDLRSDERRVYFGWLARHGRTAPPELRLDAAVDALRVDRSDSAQATFAFVSSGVGGLGAALTTYERLAERGGHLRARNHARWLAVRSR